MTTKTKIKLSSKKTTGKQTDGKRASTLKKAVPTIAAVKRAVKAGKTVGQICADFGISRVTFYKRLGAAVLGISPRNNRITK